MAFDVDEHFGKEIEFGDELADVRHLFSCAAPGGQEGKEHTIGQVEFTALELFAALGEW